MAGDLVVMDADGGRLSGYAGEGGRRAALAGRVKRALYTFLKCTPLPSPSHLRGVRGQQMIFIWDFGDLVSNFQTHLCPSAVPQILDTCFP